jgi:transcriptional regulator with XRE-family HTH domain
MTQRALAAAAIPSGYLSEIENGKKPGSVAAYRALARTLAVSMQDLVGDA